MESLIDLFQAKSAVKEFKTTNLSFKLRTLTTDELIDVLRRADLVSTSDTTKIFVAKKLTVAYSLEAVNGVEVMALPEIARLRADEKNKDLSKVDLLLQVIGNFDADAIEELYNCYNTLLVENDKKRAELKKASVVR